MMSLAANYYDIKKPSSYGGVARLHRSLSGVKRKEVENFLSGEDTYTLHKPVRKRYKTCSTRASAIDHIWQMDITDMRKYSTFNTNVKFLLFVIDVYSRYLWVIPLKDKHAKTVTEAVIDIIRKDERIPGLIHTDRGGEFTGTQFQNMLKDIGIGYYNTFSVNKATIVERVQRTIKERMHRYFTRKRSYEYIDILPDLVSSYNRSFHRIINTTPTNVVNNLNTPRSSTCKKIEKAKYRVGDYVRVSRQGTIFKKGYEEGWTMEVFKIIRVKTQFDKPLYYLEDLNGESIQGGFYSEELQRINFDPSTRKHLIEKIIKTKGRGKGKRYLVKWLGYSDAFNSYIKESDIEIL